MRSRAIVFASLVLLVAPLGLSMRTCRHGARHHQEKHRHQLHRAGHHTFESPLERLAR